MHSTLSSPSFLFPTPNDNHALLFVGLAPTRTLRVPWECLSAANGSVFGRVLYMYYEEKPWMSGCGCCIKRGSYKRNSPWCVSMVTFIYKCCNYCQLVMICRMRSDHSWTLLCKLTDFVFFGIGIDRRTVPHGRVVIIVTTQISRVAPLPLIRSFLLRIRANVTIHSEIAYSHSCIFTLTTGFTYTV